MLLRLCRDVRITRTLSCSALHRGGVRRLGQLLAVALLVIAAFPISAWGAPINYGDFLGATVNYLMVQEDANSAGDTPPLFGKPTILENPFPALPCTTATCTLPANTLDFNPVGFSANSAGGGAPDITDGNLGFMVEAKPNQAINNILIQEFGDLTMAGNVPLNSLATSTVVRMPVFIDIVEVDGVGINPIKLSDLSVPPIVATYNPSNGDFYLGVDGNGGPLFNTTWTGELFVDLQSVLVSNNVSFTRGITKINVNLDNVLIATSEANTSALIAKKDHFIVTTNIPEPASWGLALMAMIVGGCFTRRGCQ